LRGALILLSQRDAAADGISPPSLHDALPIGLPLPPRFCSTRSSTWVPSRSRARSTAGNWCGKISSHRASGTHVTFAARASRAGRSEEHTSELQSREKLVCRLLLETKENTTVR